MTPVGEKAYGNVYREAYDSAVGTHKDAIADGIAAVARHVFAEGMAAYLAEQDKQVEPPKPEAADDAGDWATVEARRQWSDPRACKDEKDEARGYREAAERHYGEKIMELQMKLLEANNKLLEKVGTPSQLEHAKRLADQLDAMEKELDAARAECERLKEKINTAEANLQEYRELVPSDADLAKVTRPPTAEECNDGFKPAPAEAGEDELRRAIWATIRKRYPICHDDDVTGTTTRLMDAILPMFYSVRAVNAGLQRFSDDAEHSACEWKQRAEAAESELAKRPDDRSCLAALMAIGGSLGLTGIVNPTHAVGGVESMKVERDKLKCEEEIHDELIRDLGKIVGCQSHIDGKTLNERVAEVMAARDKLAAELCEVREAMAWCFENTAVGWSVANSEWEVWQSGMMIAKAKDRTDAILAAFRATKGKEQGDA